jgi:hypothetical protein
VPVNRWRDAAVAQSLEIYGQSNTARVSGWVQCSKSARKQCLSCIEGELVTGNEIPRIVAPKWVVAFND